MTITPSTPTLNDIDAKVQLRLRNIVNSPLSLQTRVSAYNDVIDFLQSKSNWLCTKRVGTFDYLDGESDYSLVNILGITDFKAYKDLRFINDDATTQDHKFEEKNDIDFAVLQGQNNLNDVVTFETRDTDILMRVLTSVPRGVVIVDQLNSLTAASGGTWIVDPASTANTLTADTTRSKVGGAALMFNITPSGGILFAGVEVATPGTVTFDATNYVNNGYWRFWLGLHNVSTANLALISSVQLYWGSDSSNYWYQTTTSTINGGTFKNTWNRLSFAWYNATKVGNPDVTKLGFYYIKINYANGFTASVNIRLDELKIFDPEEMELVYFSNNFVMTPSGTFQPHFTTSVVNLNEQILLPYKHINLFLNLALKVLVPQKERGSDDYVRAVNEIREQLPLAINQSGEAITREKEEFELDGVSSGRDDMNYTHW